MRRSSCNTKNKYKLNSHKVFQSSIGVEISNKVRLAFDRPKAKQFRAMGKSSSMIAHWLHKTILQGLMENHESVKCFGRNEASKRLGAQVKSWKRKIF
jgi:hypothetical protein